MVTISDPYGSFTRGQGGADRVVVEVEIQLRGRPHLGSRPLSNVRGFQAQPVEHDIAKSRGLEIVGQIARHFVGPQPTPRLVALGGLRRGLERPRVPTLPNGLVSHHG